MEETPVTYNELRLRLQHLLPSLAQGQERIARLLLSDPEGCAFRTIGQMARAAKVHESSVVRFSVMLGLDGYPALAKLCREELAEQAQLIRRFEQARQNGASDNLLARVVEDDQRNLARSFANIDAATWSEAVKLLATAPSVYVMGLRKCFSIAYLLVYLLHLMRRNVRQIGSAGGILVDELRDLSPGDLFVAISIYRYSADTLRALNYARDRGLKTIVLTDSPASPLFPSADVVFYAETGGVTILRSLTAFTTLAQALATAVALKLNKRGRSALLLDEELLDAFGVYVEGPEDAEPGKHE
jgi:DNA-binding MurR/RpiR family transcriptional regulator